MSVRIASFDKEEARKARSRLEGGDLLEPMLAIIILARDASIKG